MIGMEGGTSLQWLCGGCLFSNLGKNTLLSLVVKQFVISIFKLKDSVCVCVCLKKLKQNPGPEGPKLEKVGA